LERGKKLGLNNGRYGEMGRIKSSITKIKECKFVSKAMGMREVNIQIFMFNRLDLPKLYYDSYDAK